MKPNTKTLGFCTQIELTVIRIFIFTIFFIISFLTYATESAHQGENENVVTKKNKQATPSDIISSLESQKLSIITRNPHPFKGSAELGILYKTGNSNSGDVKTGIDLRFEDGAWLSLINIDFLLKKTDTVNDKNEKQFTTTDEKWTITSQTNYSFANKEQNYIYGSIWYEENEFSGFDNQSSISTGWGKHWYRTNNTSLWGDIGPGYKRDLYEATETEPQYLSDTFIVQVQLLYISKLDEHIEFKQHLSIKQALDTDENSIYKAETIITTKLISTLQVKFTVTLGYNTKVENNIKKLDTQTAVALVYSF